MKQISFIRDYENKYMTTYERIREIRNKMFPDDGIIREMDKVEFLGNVYYAGKRDTRDYEDVIILLEAGDITRHVKIAGNRGAKIKKIKKEVTLNDILLMINKKNSDYAMDSGGNLLIYKEDAGMYDMYQDLKIKLNLSKSIKDQDEETLIKILSLIE